MANEEKDLKKGEEPEKKAEKEVNGKVEKGREMTLPDTIKLGDVLAKSRRFGDVQSAHQAVVQILAGRELGIGPITSMTKIYIVKGKVCLSAEIMAGQIKKDKEYDYHIKNLTNEECVITFSQNGKEIGVSTFTMDDAKRAGVLKEGSGWQKFPRNMLFARAMSNGCRWFAPHLISGAYTPEEMGTTIDQKGEVINGEVIETKAVESETVAEPEETKTSMDERKKIIGDLKEKLGKKIYDEVKEEDGKKGISDLKKKYKIEDLKKLREHLGLEEMKNIKKSMKISDKILGLSEDVFQEFIKAISVKTE